MTYPRAAARTHGVELRVIDYKVEPMQAIADATGTATLTTQRSVQADEIWRIERLVMQAVSGRKLDLAVTDGATNSGAINIGLRDFGQMPAGFPQVAEYPQAVTLLPSQQYTVIATGAAAGDVVTGLVQYAIMMKVPVPS
ncbi:MAG: hypothetical protein ACRDVE_18020 [Actinocrinis sp.]